MSTNQVTLRRTPVTWAIYGAIGAWAAFVYLSGPVSPILVDDLGVTAAAPAVPPAVPPALPLVTCAAVPGVIGPKAVFHAAFFMSRDDSLRIRTGLPLL